MEKCLAHLLKGVTGACGASSNAESYSISRVQLMTCIASDARKWAWFKKAFILGNINPSRRCNLAAFGHSSWLMQAIVSDSFVSCA